MANNTFVGFPHGQGGTGIAEADVVREIQAETSWDRQGNYTVTRRWRGPLAALKNFSEGGASNKDHAGTYFSGANGIVGGGAGRDGAIRTELTEDEGGQLGVFSATWVTRNLQTAKWVGAPPNPTTRGAAAPIGDQFQESSIWTLDGNDLEKSIYDCQIIEACEKKLNDHVDGTGNGFGARLRVAIDRYGLGQDKEGNNLADPYQTEFKLSDYFNGVLTILAGGASVTGGTNLQTDVESLCEDILRGMEAFTISQYVLRNTKTTQYTSSLTPHYEDVNRIWTTAQIKTLMSAETKTIDPPTSIVDFTLPLLGILGGTIFQTSKWLYRTPDVQQLGNGEWQITKEWYEGDDISTNVYKNKGVT